MIRFNNLRSSLKIFTRLCRASSGFARLCFAASGFARLRFASSGFALHSMLCIILFSWSEIGAMERSPHDSDTETSVMSEETLPPSDDGKKGSVKIFSSIADIPYGKPSDEKVGLRLTWNRAGTLVTVVFISLGMVHWIRKHKKCAQERNRENIKRKAEGKEPLKPDEAIGADTAQPDEVNADTAQPDKAIGVDTAQPDEAKRRHGVAWRSYKRRQVPEVEWFFTPWFKYCKKLMDG